MKKILFILLVLGAGGACAQQATRLQVELKNVNTDTLVFYLTENSIVRIVQTIRLPLKQGRADTTIQISRPAHALLKIAGQEVAGILEPGNDLAFKGNVSDLEGGTVATELFRFKNNLFKNKHQGLKVLISKALTQDNPYAYMLHYADSAERVLTQHLTAANLTLSNAAMRMLDADIKATFLSLRYDLPTYVAHESPRALRVKGIASGLSFTDSLAYSDTYAEAVYTIIFKEYSDMNMVDNQHILADKYRFIDSLLPGKLRLPVVTLFLESDLSKLNQGEELEQIMRTEYKGHETSNYAQYIAKRIGWLFKSGMPAPAFSLEGVKGKKVSLNDLKGKVVYMDFWFRECVPCRALFERLKPVRERFKADTNVVFLSVSIDDRETWLKGLKEFKMDGLPVYTNGLRAKHPVISAYKVAGYPTTTLIDRQGRIFLATPSDVPEELTRQIEAALKAP
jgi:peroxiredoxin